jgi:hypothetical protein
MERRAARYQAEATAEEEAAAEPAAGTGPAPEGGRRVGFSSSVVGGGTNETETAAIDPTPRSAPNLASQLSSLQFAGNSGVIEQQRVVKLTKGAVSLRCLSPAEPIAAPTVSTVAFASTSLLTPSITAGSLGSKSRSVRGRSPRCSSASASLDSLRAIGVGNAALNSLPLRDDSSPPRSRQLLPQPQVYMAGETASQLSGGSTHSAALVGQGSRGSSLHADGSQDVAPPWRRSTSSTGALFRTSTLTLRVGGHTDERQHIIASAADAAAGATSRKRGAITAAAHLGGQCSRGGPGSTERFTVGMIRTRAEETAHQQQLLAAAAHSKSGE